MTKKSLEERVKSLRDNLKCTFQMIAEFQQYMQKIENELDELETQIAEDKKNSYNLERAEHDKFMEDKFARDLSATRRSFSAETFNERSTATLNNNLNFNRGNIETAPRPVPVLRQKDNPVSSSINMINHSNISSSEKNFLQEYNDILSETDGYKKKTAREEFISKYNVRAFNCINFNERMNNPALTAIFEEVSPVRIGDYWAIPVSEKVFKVVPNVKAYNENYHIARAMGEVFNSGFNFSTYSKIYVDMAAEFTNSGQFWRLIKKGKIILR